MTLKKRQPPKSPKSVSEVNEMPNANDRLIELESIIERWSKQVHKQSVELERIKSRQQVQDQLNDDSADALSKLQVRAKRLEKKAANQEEYAYNNDKHIERHETSIEFLAAVMNDERNQSQQCQRKSKSFATLCYTTSVCLVIATGGFIAMIGGRV